MEIVTIEKKTFELWKQRFESFVGRMDAKKAGQVAG